MRDNNVCVCVCVCNNNVCVCVCVCVCSLRGRMHALEHKLYPDLSANNQRTELLPVEWRSSLKLDGGEKEAGFRQSIRNTVILTHSNLDEKHHLSYRTATPLCVALQLSYSTRNSHFDTP